MKKPNPYVPKIGDIVSVDWIDAFTSSSWKEVSEITDEYIEKNSVVKGQIGYVVKNNEKGIVTAIYLKGNDVGSVSFVPAGMITNIRLVEAGK